MEVYMKHLLFQLWLRLLGVDTTVTTILESIPTIVGAALLELGEGDIVSPLITQIDFPGPGYIHQTPSVVKLSAAESDAPTAEAIEMSGSDETSASMSATVAIHSAYVQLKDLCNLTSIEDMAALAGQLIGNAIVVRKDLDLVTLFTSFSTDQGGVTASGAMAPADLYDAYGSLRLYHAPLPYHLALNPQQIWKSIGLISLFDNSSDAVQSAGVGTVGEDWARSGFAGMVMGFNLWSDANIVFTTSANGQGAAFSRQAIKQVYKRGFQIEIERDTANLANKIVGSEIRGETILRNKHGNGMQFPLGLS
jgi:hypothetical protein